MYKYGIHYMFTYRHRLMTSDIYFEFVIYIDVSKIKNFAINKPTFYQHTFLCISKLK